MNPYLGGSLLSSPQQQQALNNSNNNNQQQQMNPQQFQFQLQNQPLAQFQHQQQQQQLPAAMLSGTSLAGSSAFGGQQQQQQPQQQQQLTIAEIYAQLQKLSNQGGSGGGSTEGQVGTRPMGGGGSFGAGSGSFGAAAGGGFSSSVGGGSSNRVGGLDLSSLGGLGLDLSSLAGLGLDLSSLIGGGLDLSSLVGGGSMQQASPALLQPSSNPPSGNGGGARSSDSVTLQMMQQQVALLRERILGNPNIGGGGGGGGGVDLGAAGGMVGGGAASACNSNTNPFAALLEGALGQQQHVAPPSSQLDWASLVLNQPLTSGAGGNGASQSNANSLPEGLGPEDTSCLPAALPAILAIPEDNMKLSGHQVFLRHQIEAFKANEDDISTHTRGRNKPIQLGQVGIRCRHCSRLPVARRQKGSTYFPASLHGLYQAAQNMNTTHMQSGLCTEMPQEFKDHFTSANNKRVSSSVAGRPYWARTAKMLGFVDTEDGIRFIRELTPAQVIQIKEWQQHQKKPGNTLYSSESKKIAKQKKSKS